MRMLWIRSKLFLFRLPTRLLIGKSKERKRGFETGFYELPRTPRSMPLPAARWIKAWVETAYLLNCSNRLAAAFSASLS